jgi:hypothetical protein
MLGVESLEKRNKVREIVPNPTATAPARYKSITLDCYN